MYQTATEVTGRECGQGPVAKCDSAREQQRRRQSRWRELSTASFLLGAQWLSSVYVLPDRQREESGDRLMHKKKTWSGDVMWATDHGVGMTAQTCNPIQSIHSAPS